MSPSFYNPSLREEPRHQLAGVIPLKQEASILDWLEQSGRLIAREVTESDYLDDDEELADTLLGTDDGSYDDIDDDDDDLIDVDEAI